MKKLTPEQASATKKRPCGISMYKPLLNKGIPVKFNNATEPVAATS